MIIAINLTNFISGASKDLVYTQFERLAVSRPEDQFIFIITKNQELPLVLTGNISFVISTPKANTILLQNLWYDYTLPALVKKYKAAVLVNTDGVCSLRTKTRQSLFITDIGFINTGNNLLNKYHRHLQKKTPAFFKKATNIITSTRSLQKEIEAHYKNAEEKIITVPLSISEKYQPLDWKEKEDVKDTFAEGKEYFLFVGEIGERTNLVNLLKAFSFFKRRQKSNMQLIIAVRQAANNNAFTESLKTYKYRNEVKVLFNLPDEKITKLTAAAYAFVYPVWYDNFPFAPLSAVQSGAPLILSGTDVFKEIAGDAALYVQPDNIEDIAQKMMLLFKDETQRNELIRSGKEQAIHYQQNNHADLLWRAIVGAIEI